MKLERDWQSMQGLNFAQPSNIRFSKGAPRTMEESPVIQRFDAPPPVDDQKIANGLILVISAGTIAALLLSAVAGWPIQ